MAAITIKKGYLELLNSLGCADTAVEDAIRKYLIDKCVERIEKSKREIEEFERKYDCNYAEFITKVSIEDGLKAIEKKSPNWEEDMIAWEYWEKELEEWKMRLEDILIKS